MKINRYGGGYVHVGVSMDGRTGLHVPARGTMTAQRYRYEVLDPIVTPYPDAVGEAFILMHDNAHPHTGRIYTAYPDQQGIEVMDWPSRFPDFNPIEHMSDILNRRVQGRQPPPHDVLTIRLY